MSTSYVVTGNMDQDHIMDDFVSPGNKNRLEFIQSNLKKENIWWGLAIHSRPPPPK